MTRQRQQVKRALRQHAAEQAAARFTRQVRLALAARLVDGPTPTGTRETPDEADR